jgi:hypothetical protein
MSPKERSSRLWIGLLLLTLLALLMAGLSFLVFSSWSELRSVTPEEAERSFAAGLAAAGGEPAYIEIDTGGAARVRRELEGEEAQDLETMHVLAWDPQGSRLLVVAFPFWFVRLKMSDTFNLGTLLALLHLDWTNLDLKVTEEDLRRRGKGLILDFRLENGRRILLWNE